MLFTPKDKEGYWNETDWMCLRFFMYTLNHMSLCLDKHIHMMYIDIIERNQSIAEYQRKTPKKDAKDRCGEEIE